MVCSCTIAYVNYKWQCNNYSMHKKSNIFTSISKNTYILSFSTIPLSNSSFLLKLSSKFTKIAFSSPNILPNSTTTPYLIHLYDQPLSH
ncbi:hypothetical protein MIMGU_mgv1a017219mg [Erythranthe guttata]|uniref:Uncharacterized protein n=1 Tax=Erythranthe guttata TaxID=4155 RepID=A0A022QEI0_ERYGU|nr:hypothetical protein MIMGU_mgv1a017219mg [Erythranthe guttata]